MGRGSRDIAKIVPATAPAGVANPDAIMSLTNQLHENKAQAEVLSQELLAATDMVLTPIRELLEARSSDTPITFDVDGTPYTLYSVACSTTEKGGRRNKNRRIQVLACEAPIPQTRIDDNNSSRHARKLLLLPTQEQRQLTADKKRPEQPGRGNMIRWDENLSMQEWLNIHFASDKIMAAFGQQSQQVVQQIQTNEQAHLDGLTSGLATLDQLYPEIS